MGPRGGDPIRKTVATILILCVVSIGYTAWPIYDLLVLVRAIESRDVDTVTRHVYFDAVRASLTNQIVAAYVQRSLPETIQDLLGDELVKAMRTPPQRR